MDAFLVCCKWTCPWMGVQRKGGSISEILLPCKHINCWRIKLVYYKVGCVGNIKWMLIREKWKQSATACKCPIPKPATGQSKYSQQSHCSSKLTFSFRWILFNRMPTDKQTKTDTLSKLYVCLEYKQSKIKWKQNKGWWDGSASKGSWWPSSVSCFQSLGSTW